jgi:hypothetical protein
MKKACGYDYWFWRRKTVLERVYGARITEERMEWRLEYKVDGFNKVKII